MSFGGGVQSTAMLVLAAKGVIDYPVALFANVGEDSENPATLEYIERYSRPYAEQHGIEFVSLDRIKRDGSRETVMSRIKDSTRSIGIPVRMSSGMPANRNCTIDFKVKVIAKEVKRRGATKDDPAHVALGISLDEFHRMKPSRLPVQVSEWPLVDMRISRNDCLQIIKDAGLPRPPKSSCWFCPFHTRQAWRDMKREDPDTFIRSVELERYINNRREKIGKNPVWLSSMLRPLDEAFADTGQLPMFQDDATCDIGGYCHS